MFIKSIKWWSNNNNKRSADSFETGDAHVATAQVCDATGDDR
jgi:hypothetical protein